MTTPFTKTRLTEVEDQAPKHGHGEIQQARFANADLETEGTGISYQRFEPGRRQAFGHRHAQAEEIYVVLAGSGRVKLDDEIVELESRDAIRVAPAVMRAFEAGPDGLELIAVSALYGTGDVEEAVPNWWDD